MFVWWRGYAWLGFRSFWFNFHWTVWKGDTVWQLMRTATGRFQGTSDVNEQIPRGCHVLQKYWTKNKLKKETVRAEVQRICSLPFLLWHNCTYRKHKSSFQHYVCTFNWFKFASCSYNPIQSSICDGIWSTHSITVNPRFNRPRYNGFRI